MIPVIDLLSEIDGWCISLRLHAFPHSHFDRSMASGQASCCKLGMIPIQQEPGRTDQHQIPTFVLPDTGLVDIALSLRSAELWFSQHVTLAVKIMGKDSLILVFNLFYSFISTGYLEFIQLTN